MFPDSKKSPLRKLWEDCGFSRVAAELDRAPDNKMQRNNLRLLSGDVRGDLIGVLSTSNLRYRLERDGKR